jgi:hypothetical protein
MARLLLQKQPALLLLVADVAARLRWLECRALLCDKRFRVDDLLFVLCGTSDRIYAVVDAAEINFLVKVLTFTWRLL